jgi:hypothetical protein
MAWNSWLLLADALMAGIILGVQLLVYPGFKYFDREGLNRWHAVYTRNITGLVAPLMTVQLLGGLYWTVAQPGLRPLLYALGILALWSMTFIYFVPLHKQISQGNANAETFKYLVRLNRIRTVLWILILSWHLFCHWEASA